MIKLGVLDQTPIKTGSNAYDAIQETINLAIEADKLGYARYWVAEHHGSQGLAGSVPEILISKIATVTKKIRVGSGGVMLNHYSPFKVAETFSFLSTLYPDRIDLGLGRAPGGDKLISAAMSYGSKIGTEYYPTKIIDLMAFFNGTEHANKALSGITISPKSETLPQIWLLGSSLESAKIAALLGLPFSYAHFIYPDGAKDTLNLYNEEFKPNDLMSQPLSNICVSVVCAEKKEIADFHAKSRKLWKVQLSKGNLGPYPTPHEADLYNYSLNEERIIKKNNIDMFVGEPKVIKEELEALCTECNVDEALILTITHDKIARLKSYELISKVFNL